MPATHQQVPSNTSGVTRKWRVAAKAAAMTRVTTCGPNWDVWTSLYLMFGYGRLEDVIIYVNRKMKCIYIYILCVRRYMHEHVLTGLCLFENIFQTDWSFDTDQTHWGNLGIGLRWGNPQDGLVTVEMLILFNSHLPLMGYNHLGAPTSFILSPSSKLLATWSTHS